MPHTSETMRRFAALLADELFTWPEVTAKPMFGVQGFYRGKQIFAAVPAKRALFSPDSLLIRFCNASPELRERIAAEPRFHAEQMGRRWFPFEVMSADDLRDALKWLAEAHEAAAPVRKRAAKRR